MKPHFSAESVQACQMAIDLTIHKGGQIFQRKFKNVLKQAQIQSSSALDSIVRNSVNRPDQPHPISFSPQPNKIHMDNLASKTASVQKRSKPMSMNKPRYRAAYREYQSSADSHSVLKSRSRSRNFSRNSVKKPFIRLNPQTPLTEQQQQRVQMQDKYRRWRAALSNSQYQQKLSEEIKNRYQLEMQKNTIRQRASLQGRNLTYTFDYQGKVVLCAAVNYQRKLHNDQLCTHVNAKTPVEEKPVDEEQVRLEELRRDVMRGEVFRSMGRVGAKRNAAAERLGCDYQRNDEYNNGNSRQVSSIPFMQLTPGVKIQQSQNSLLLQNSLPNRLHKDQFLDLIRNRRFKSHHLQQLALTSQRQSKSAMTGQLANPNLNRTQQSDRSKLTSSTVLRKTGEVRMKAAYKVVPFNLFNTTQDTWRTQKEPRGKEGDRIRVEDRMAGFLLEEGDREQGE